MGDKKNLKATLEMSRKLADGCHLICAVRRVVDCIEWWTFAGCNRLLLAREEK